MTYLNGAFRRKEDEEIMSAFLSEQGSNATPYAREQLRYAYAAERRGELGIAEVAYKEVLTSVGHSDLVIARLDRIYTKRGNR